MDSCDKYHPSSKLSCRAKPTGSQNHSGSSRLCALEVGEEGWTYHVANTRHDRKSHAVVSSWV